MGRSLWDFISDWPTRQVYEKILMRVRKGQEVKLILRCDGPSHRRLLEMSIALEADNSVSFTTRVLGVEEREPVPLLVPSTRQSDELVRVCGWCNRVYDGAWVEAEVATERMRLFERPAMPRLTNGMCEDCFDAASHLGMTSN